MLHAGLTQCSAQTIVTKFGIALSEQRVYSQRRVSIVQVPSGASEYPVFANWNAVTVVVGCYRRGMNDIMQRLRPGARDNTRTSARLLRAALQERQDIDTSSYVLGLNVGAQVSSRLRSPGPAVSVDQTNPILGSIEVRVTRSG